MADDRPDYYRILGLPRNANDKEIRDAFRALARKYHPDALKGLPENERKRQTEQMYLINEANGVLSDRAKRQEYDRQGSREENPVRERPPAPVGWEGSPFVDFRTLFGDYDIFGRPRIKEDSFMIPENDWGLLAALKMAYESKEDGKWRVRRVVDDKRDLPSELYSVKREKGSVFVFRRIIDWRSEWDRDRVIEVRDRENFSKTEKEMQPDTFLGEYYLYGEGRDKLGGIVSVDIPRQFGEYLQAMKSLAEKFAARRVNKEGRYDVADELRAINLYGEFGAKNTRVEGRSVWQEDENREWVRRIKFENFWQRLQRAEDRVTQIEGIPTSPEFKG